MVVDNRIYTDLGRSFKKVHEHCKIIANIINAVSLNKFCVIQILNFLNLAQLYTPLNIFIALSGVVIWSDGDKIELHENSEKTLINFMEYRKTQLITLQRNDNAQLLTRQVFEGGVVGKAWKGTMCSFHGSGGIATDHSEVIAMVATTIAHEMGHNFGMDHDDPENCECTNCIMAAAVLSKPPRHWSQCSIDELNYGLHHGLDHCLRNKPKMLFESSTCGNGFVEADEECDCGLPQFCENSCCNPKTCKRRDNATCATGSCCDLSTCKLHSAGM